MTIIIVIIKLKIRKEWKYIKAKLKGENLLESNALFLDTFRKLHHFRPFLSSKTDISTQIDFLSLLKMWFPWLGNNFFLVPLGFVTPCFRPVVC